MNIPYFDITTFKTTKKSWISSGGICQNHFYRCNSTGKEINTGAGKKLRQLIVIDCILILHLINKGLIVVIKIISRSNYVIT
jgi:hypothetical protein